MIEIRCKKCGSKVCEVKALSGEVTFPCKKCKTWNRIVLDIKEVLV